MSETRNYQTVLIADDVDYGEKGGVKPGAVREFAESQDNVFWVEGPIPADTSFPDGAIVFSYQKDLVAAQITKAVKDGAFDGVIVAAKNVLPEEIGKTADGKPLYRFETEEGTPFVLYADRIGAGINNVEEVGNAGGIFRNTVTFNSWATVESLELAAQLVTAPIDLYDQHRRVMDDTADSNNLAPDYTGQIEGKRVGVIGAGAIGTEFIIRMRQKVGPKGSVIAFSPSFDEEQAHHMGIETAQVYKGKRLGADGSIIRVFEGADLAMIQAPLNDKTKGMLKARNFEDANPGFGYVNYARAGLEESVEMLGDLIRSQQIGGAAFDFDSRPGDTSAPMTPYREMFRKVSAEGVIKDPRRFVFSHHTAADTKGPARRDGAIQAIKQMITGLRGGTIINYVGGELGKRETEQQELDHVGLVRRMSVVGVTQAHGEELAKAAQVLATLLGDGKTPISVEAVGELMGAANTIRHTLPTGRPVEKMPPAGVRTL